MKASSLNVEVTSRQETSRDGLRSWVVSVKTDLSGEAVDMSAVTRRLVVKSTRSELDVACLGALDLSTAVYRISECRKMQPMLDLPLAVEMTPRYHSATGQLYRLEPGLASLVGRTYLQHPKYALTLVLAYVRAKHLQKGQIIICEGQDRREHGHERRLLRGVLSQ